MGGGADKGGLNSGWKGEKESGERLWGLPGKEQIKYMGNMIRDPHLFISKRSMLFLAHSTLSSLKSNTSLGPP